MDPKNTRSGGDLSHFDSKIKDLYLKLHDFSFFHSPSGLQKPDARFVGREKIIRKLVNILSNSETKAGAYLVTGYRGVGKTSLVRKALAQLRAEPRLGASKIRWLFLFSFLIGVTGGSRALTDWFTQSWIWLVSAGIPVLALFALMSSYNLLALIRSSDLQNDRKRDLSSTDIVRFFGNLVVLEILKMIFLSVLGEWAGYYTRFLISHSAAFLLLAAVYKVAYLWELAREWQFKNSPSEEKLWKGVWGSIKSQVEFRLKNRSKIPIELSLAQKDLTDRDILRLIAINVYKQYRRVRHPLYSFRKFLWVVGANVFLYVFAAILYYNGFVYQSIQGTWENGVANYLPSQQVWINDSLQNSLNTYYLEADSNGLSFEKYMGYFSMPEVSAISDSLPQVLKWQQQANYIVNQFGEPTTQRSKARNSIKRITWRLDFFITSLFHSVVDGFKGRVVQINDGTQKKKKAQKDANRQFVLHSNFSLLPRFPDYLFFIFYGFIVGGFHLVKRLLPAMGVETHRSVVRQLKVLNARIEANVSLGEEQNSGWSRGGFGLGLLRSIRRTFPIATAREIETELIEIFNLIDRIPSLAFRPEFIFILDELDKVEVHGELFRSGDSEQEKSGPRPAFGPEYTRQKQEAIAGLLGNMKHFLNVAKAKFIFIASREMYDVSLADISDRDSYIGSVFHEVLHVPSFFTDSYQTDSADVTRLTEEYVCQFLVPRHGKYANSLEGYYQYLSQEVFVVAHGEQDRVRCQWQLQKVIFTLQNFIVYLTYRSNGKPKYLTRLFEEHVEKLLPSKVADQLVAVPAKSYEDQMKTECFYLHFNELRQYKFGFTAYIFSQFLVTQSRYMREYGDKLLVSTSYLIDHLYKFHNYAFSWQNLEVTPELIDINKAPELRSFVRELLGAISNIHLREIVSGLHQFKFYNKITNEIRYISKVSEIEASAFNFTLDEHLQTKRYYEVRLKQLKSAYNEFYPDDRRGEYIHSIGSIHMTLGDMQYFDQEYKDAKLQYSDAIQALQGVPLEDMTMEQFLLLVRSKMKLGLAHERTGGHDAALSVYGSIANRVVELRDLEFEGFDLVKVVLNRREIPQFVYRFKSQLLADSKWNSQIDFSKDANNSNEKALKTAVTKFFGNRKEQVFYGRLYLHVIKDKANKKRKYYRFNEVQFFHSFADHFLQKLYELPVSPNKEKGFLKRTIFESFRLIYQPLFARLQAIEKSSMGGITIADLKRTEKEFEFLWAAVIEQQKPLIQAEFYNKVGHILYYKNGFLLGTYDKDESVINLKVTDLDERKNRIEAFGEKDDKTRYRLNLRAMRERFQLVGCSKDFKAPLHAYKFYLRTLLVLQERVFKYRMGKSDSYELGGDPYEKLPGLFYDFLVFLTTQVPEKEFAEMSETERGQAEKEELKFPTMRDTMVEEIGNCFSDLGDALLGMIPRGEAAEDKGFKLHKENSIHYNFFITLIGGNKKVKANQKGAEDWILKKEDRLKGLIARVKQWKTEWDKKKDDQHTQQVDEELLLSRIEQVMLCYCYASMYFLRANLHLKYSQQNIKLLYLLKDYTYSYVQSSCFKSKTKPYWIVNDTKKRNNNEEVPLSYVWNYLRHGLVGKVLRAVHRSHLGASHIEVERLFFRMMEPYDSEHIILRKEDEYKNGNGTLRQAIRNSLSNSPEVREVLVLYFDLYMQVESRLPFRLPSDLLLHAYSMSDNKFGRVLELRFKMHVNKLYFKMLEKALMDSGSRMEARIAWVDKEISLQRDLYELEGITKIELTELKRIHNYYPGDDVSAVLRYLITDSIYCLWEAIKAYKVYGISYMTSHSVVGTAYRTLGYWCTYYQILLKSYETHKGYKAIKALNDEMSVKLGVEGRSFLNPAYHYEQAIHHLYSALQTHNEGPAYHKNLQRMYYLEDDYSDKLYHFGAATERYKINTGGIRALIDDTKNKLRELKSVNDLYDVDGYVTPNGF